MNDQDYILKNYQWYNYSHALEILMTAYPREWNEICSVLSGFRLYRSDIETPGGRKSPIARKLDSQFYDLGWQEKSFNTCTVVDGYSTEIPTHSVDCYKNRIALEVEWNNKDPFFDRDLNNFRLLFDLNVISVGVIITRCTHLQSIFNSLGKGDSYGASTTHFDKLVPRIDGRGSGGCPVLAFGISDNLYFDYR